MQPRTNNQSPSTHLCPDNMISIALVTDVKSDYSLTEESKNIQKENKGIHVKTASKCMCRYKRKIHWMISELSPTFYILFSTVGGQMEVREQPLVLLFRMAIYVVLFLVRVSHWDAHKFLLPSVETYTSTSLLLCGF